MNSRKSVKTRKLPAKALTNKTLSKRKAPGKKLVSPKGKDTAFSY